MLRLTFGKIPIEVTARRRIVLVNPSAESRFTMRLVLAYGWSLPLCVRNLDRDQAGFQTQKRCPLASHSCWFRTGEEIAIFCPDRVPRSSRCLCATGATPVNAPLGYTYSQLGAASVMAELIPASLRWPVLVSRGRDAANALYNPPPQGPLSEREGVRPDHFFRSQGPGDPSQRSGRRGRVPGILPAPQPSLHFCTV